MNKKFKSVDEYISSLPARTKAQMKKLRETISKSAPQAEEIISYNMPAFRFHGMLVYYAVHTEHIGFYPFSSAIQAFEKKLTKYECSKGTVRFPFGKPIPVTLVSRMVKFRMKENAERAALKKKKY